MAKHRRGIGGEHWQFDLPPTSTKFADISASEVAVSCATGEIAVRLALPVHPE